MMKNHTFGQMDQLPNTYTDPFHIRLGEEKNRVENRKKKNVAIKVSK